MAATGHCSQFVLGLVPSLLLCVVLVTSRGVGVRRWRGREIGYVALGMGLGYGIVVLGMWHIVWRCTDTWIICILVWIYACMVDGSYDFECTDIWQITTQ
jgi:hypothetical protein